MADVASALDTTAVSRRRLSTRLQDAGADALPPAADGATCKSDADFAQSQVCIHFAQTKGLIVLSHTQCLTPTCATADCSCAPPMCNNLTCSVSTGQLTCTGYDP